MNEDLLIERNVVSGKDIRKKLNLCVSSKQPAQSEREISSHYVQRVF
jgi:hypothetical protein